MALALAAARWALVQSQQSTGSGLGTMGSQALLSKSRDRGNKGRKDLDGTESRKHNRTA